MTRAEMIDELALGIRVEARLVELRRLADDVSATYRELIAHGASVEQACAYFACSLLLERLREEDQRRGGWGEPGGNGPEPRRYFTPGGGGF